MSDSVKPQNYDTCTVEEKKRNLLQNYYQMVSAVLPHTMWHSFLKEHFIFSYTCVINHLCLQKFLNQYSYFHRMVVICT